MNSNGVVSPGVVIAMVRMLGYDFAAMSEERRKYIAMLTFNYSNAYPELFVNRNILREQIREYLHNT